MTLFKLGSSVSLMFLAQRYELGNNIQSGPKAGQVGPPYLQGVEGQRDRGQRDRDEEGETLQIYSGGWAL